jgi:Cytochrome oxidase complex assembly protein 1
MSNAPQFDPNPAPPTKGWFARNWLWFVPLVGLSSGCLCCLGCGGIIFGVLQTIKSSEPYQMALAHVQADAEVRELLGEPIVESGFMPLGEVNVENGEGNASLYFHVSGPNGEASVSANATREGGQWRLTYVEVTPSDGSGSSIVWPPDAAMQQPDVDLQLDVRVEPTDEDPSVENPADAPDGSAPEGDPQENAPDGP